MELFKEPIDKWRYIEYNNSVRYGGIGYLRESYILSSASSILARTTNRQIANSSMAESTVTLL